MSVEMLDLFVVFIAVAALFFAMHVYFSTNNLSLADVEQRMHNQLNAYLTTQKPNGIKIVAAPQSDQGITIDGQNLVVVNRQTDGQVIAASQPPPTTAPRKPRKTVTLENVVLEEDEMGNLTLRMPTAAESKEQVIVVKDDRIELPEELKKRYGISTIGGGRGLAKVSKHRSVPHRHIHHRAGCTANHRRRHGSSASLSERRPMNNRAAGCDEVRRGETTVKAI